MSPCSTAAALLPLLCWVSVLVLGEVSKDFSNCLEFFHNKTPPTGFSAAGHQPICQRLGNRYRFASLFDRERRVPVYSAYILRSADGKRPNDTWKYEPQLAFSRASAEMEPFSSRVDQNVIESQAVLQDYRNSSFTKGHLNPSMHQQTKEDREATFTLTNVVPQKEGSNSGPWSFLEQRVLRKFKALCNGSMYVITGSMPYASGGPSLRNRVSVPEYMWSAYCCPAYKANLPKTEKQLFPTYAAVGRNDRTSGEEIVPVNMKARASVRGYDVRELPLQELEQILQRRLNMQISLFDNLCRSSE